MALNFESKIVLRVHRINGKTSVPLEVVYERDTRGSKNKSGENVSLKLAARRLSLSPTVVRPDEGAWNISYDSRMTFPTHVCYTYCEPGVFLYRPTTLLLPVFSGPHARLSLAGNDAVE